MNRLGQEAKEASIVLSQASLEQKNEALKCIAEKIELSREKILEENLKDLSIAKEKSIGSALIDRLELNNDRIDSMISGLKVVADLPDPIGEITDMGPTPSGIEISKMRVPLGVVGIIYESRPNVTADAAALSRRKREVFQEIRELEQEVKAQKEQNKQLEKKKAPLKLGTK